MSTIKIKEIEPNENYRTTMDKAAFTELVGSVKEKGVIQPIIVMTQKGKFPYKVVAGRRRFNAAGEAGLTEIPVVIRDDLNGEEDALELALIENGHREDPNPMDSAEGYQKLFEMGKHTPDTLATKLGKSVREILGLIKLLELPKKVQTMLKKGELSHGMAIQLTRLKSKKDFDDILENIKNGWSPINTVEQLKEVIDDDYGTSLSAARFDTKFCETCPNRSKNQVQLFPELKKTDQCMDKTCFDKTTGNHLTAEYGKLKAEGKTVLINKEVSYSHNCNFQVMHNRPKNYKHCRDKCPSHTYAVNFNQGHVEEHLYCAKPSCLKEKMAEKTKGKAAAGADFETATTGKKDRSGARQMHADALRDRFLHEQLSSRITKTVGKRMALYHVIKRLPYNQDKKLETFMKTFTQYNPKLGLYAMINEIEEKQLDKALLEASRIMIAHTDSAVLLKQAVEAEINIEKEMVWDVIYLEGHTKDELTDMVKGQAGVKFSASSKKTGMVALIRDLGLVGKNTAALVRSYKDKEEEARYR